MSHIECPAAVVLADVVGVRGKTGDAGSIAIGVVEGVVAKELQLGADSDIGVRYKLILPEDSFGDELVNIARQQIWPHTRTAWRARVGRVRVDAEELIEASRVQVSDGQSCRLGDLPLHADSRLYGVWRRQRRVGLVNGGGAGTHGATTSKGRWVEGLTESGEACRVVDDVLLLGGA